MSTRFLCVESEGTCVVFGGSSASTFVRSVNLTKMFASVWMLNGPIIECDFEMRDRHMACRGSFASEFIWSNSDICDSITNLSSVANEYSGN